VLLSRKQRSESSVSEVPLIDNTIMGNEPKLDKSTHLMGPDADGLY